MNVVKQVLVPAEEMHGTLKKILLRHQFSEEKAEECATIFTNNSMDGIYTHGINRFPRFLAYIQKGYINPQAQPTLLHQMGGIEQWKGNLGPGPSNATFATNRSMELARKNGIGCVTLSHTNHWMRGGAYAWQAAKEGFVFIAWTNTEANMPAWGAKNPKLGNNPLVFATPYEEEAIVLDMAMSQFSFGAMEMAAMKDENLAAFGGYDADGQLTNDPELILQSKRTLPIGYWKGAGLSFLLDMLAAILSGGLSVHEISNQAAEMGCSQVFIAIDLSKLSNFSSIKGTIEGIIQDYETSIPIDLHHEISYPGKRVLATRERNKSNGIPVLESIWQQVLELT